MEGCRGISFADDATGVLEGGNINDIVHGLERCAAASVCMCMSRIYYPTACKTRRS